MALTNPSAPPVVTLSEDPSLVDILTDNFLVTAGEKEKHTLSFGGGALENEGITFTWNSIHLIFVARAVPDDSGLQFLPIGVLTLQQFVQQLYETFFNNYIFTQDFDVTISGDQLTITVEAKIAGTTYNLSIFDYGSPAWQAAVTIVQVTNAVDFEYRENFRINIALFTEDGLIEGSELEAIPDDDFHAIFDLRDGLKGLVDYAFTYPEDSEELIILRPEPIKQYYFQYWESYGLPSVAKELKTSSDYYVMKGKSSYMQLTEYHELNTSFWQRLQTSHAFLTLQPNNKLISTKQVEKLFFLHYLNISPRSVRLNVKVYFTNGTDDTVFKDTLPNYERFQILECNVGFEIMELADVNPALTVEKYDVWLTTSAGVLSETKTYYVDLEYQKQTRYFLFANSLCGYDTARALGIGSNEVDYSYKKVSKLLPHNYTSKDREFNQIQVAEKRKFIVNFGILNNISGDVYAPDWKNYLRQLNLSPDRFEIINGREVPIQSLTEKFPLHNDNTKIYDAIFTYERDFVDEAFSDDEIPIDPDYNDDYNDDYLI